jgi:hypothetical protein
MSMRAASSAMNWLAAMKRAFGNIGVSDCSGSLIIERSISTIRCR